jgi:putative hydrolase of the HAD superfamily
MNGPMIFFDIDGTLLDHKRAEKAAARSFFLSHGSDLGLSADEFITSWQIAAEKHFRSYQLGRITFQEQRRERLRDLYSINRDLTDKEADQLFESYLEAYQTHWILYPDVREALDSLAPDRMGIISNGDSRQQRQKLESTGIASYFSVIQISGDIGIAKPDTEIFLQACRQAALPTKDCCYVGDSLQDDVIPANKAGLLGIWLNRQAEKNPISIPTVHSLSKIKSLLQSFK